MTEGSGALTAHDLTSAHRCVLWCQAQMPSRCGVHWRSPVHGSLEAPRIYCFFGRAPLAPIHTCYPRGDSLRETENARRGRGKSREHLGLRRWRATGTCIPRPRRLTACGTRPAPALPSIDWRPPIQYVKGSWRNEGRGVLFLTIVAIDLNR